MADTCEPLAAAPIRTRSRRVQPDWIDYNGHMNVAYYTLAFDNSLDEIFDETLGIGVTLVREARMGPMALQTQIHYLAELVEGDEFACDFQLLDADHKRIHFFVTMINLGTGAEAATYESLTVNVDLEARRSAPFPERAWARIGRLVDAHSALPRPRLAGRPLGIRRRL